MFPNGTVTTLANLSKQFAFAIVDVQVLYSENLDRVFGTIREVGASMQKDPMWSACCSRRSRFPASMSIADGHATIRTKFKTLPLNQGRVANELRRRLLATLAGAGYQALRRLSHEQPCIARSHDRSERLSLHHPLARRGTCGEVADVLARSARPAALVAVGVSGASRSSSRRTPTACGQRVRLHTKGWLPYTLDWEFVVDRVPLSRTGSRSKPAATSSGAASGRSRRTARS